MARPPKDGVDYFPFDVDFFTNRKIRLIRAEFGTDGISVLLIILCDIYKNGYYKKWDADECLFTTSTLACGHSTEKVQAILDGCIKRGVFHKRLYKRYGVLTSAGIQRRYLRAVSAREEIRLCQDYFLLDETIKKDVPSYIKSKIRFHSLPRKRTKKNIAVPLQADPLPEMQANATNNTNAAQLFEEVVF